MESIRAWSWNWIALLAGALLAGALVGGTITGWQLADEARFGGTVGALTGIGGVVIGILGISWAYASRWLGHQHVLYAKQCEAYAEITEAMWSVVMASFDCPSSSRVSPDRPTDQGARFGEITDRMQRVLLRCGLFLSAKDGAACHAFHSEANKASEGRASGVALYQRFRIAYDQFRDTLGVEWLSADWIKPPWEERLGTTS